MTHARRSQSAPLNAMPGNNRIRNASSASDSTSLTAAHHSAAGEGDLGAIERSPRRSAAAGV